MTACAATQALPTPRQWVPPTLTEHSDLVMMARAMASVFSSVVAMQGIGFSCTLGQPGCSGNG
jgi:hypothetical protein